jgi:DNA repair ATPase RecN
MPNRDHSDKRGLLPSDFEKTLDEMEFSVSKLPSIPSRLDALGEELSDILRRLDNLCGTGERMKKHADRLDEVRPELQAILERLNRQLDAAEARNAGLKPQKGSRRVKDIA